VTTLELAPEESSVVPPPVSDVQAAAPRRPPREHVPGLDGIRAVAVIGVLGFHAGVAGFGGGLLGVDIFFVLSGYLITSLLVAEWSRTGSIAFLRFYERRARRLLPGLFLVLLLVAVYAQWFAEPDTLSTLRGDAFSTLGYVANWRFVFSGQSYFVHFGPPSPLLHTWSLAVEEQFYLIWPGVALLVLRWRGKRALAVVAAAGVVLSAALTVVLFHNGVSVTRLYYGTDIRTQEVMVGALLAICLPTFVRRVSRADRSTRRSVHSAAALLGVVAALALLWALHAVSGAGGFLYQGGFLLVAGATAGVILLVVVRPRAVVSRVLSLGVLGYIGRISYGLYLYHYPLFLMIDNEHTGLTGATLLVVRLGATAAVAVLSYHLIEMPVRQRRILKGWHLVAALPIGVVVVVIALLLSTTASAPSPVTPTKAGLFTVPTAPPAVLAGDHVHVLMLGDSIALTLAEGLKVQSDRWGASVTNLGVLGCDLDPSSTVNIQGSITKAAQGCANWPVKWRQLVDQENPDVVGVELGRWEVSDRIIDGHWTRIGQPAWDNLYAKELSKAIRILSARGAHVVIFTLPYIAQTTEAPNGTPWDINQPVRTNEYNALVRKVVARSSGAASVYDLNHVADPHGVYTSYLDGIRVRNGDDEHFSLLGGKLFRPLILPTLVQLGLAHALARPHAVGTPGAS
jgi:peptidoglycan/LPS O-acetylase OafA/YrhL